MTTPGSCNPDAEIDVGDMPGTFAGLVRQDEVTVLLVTSKCIHSVQILQRSRESQIEYK